MDSIKNADGQVIVEAMISAVQDNKDYLGEIDGLIGDGDHGINMNKGFTMAQSGLDGAPHSFSESLSILGDTLFNDIGGSMGPIYGTVFTGMAEAAEGEEEISLGVLSKMMSAGLEGLMDIVDAKVGDKTLVDTLSPACDSLKQSLEDEVDFKTALGLMKSAAQKGSASTKDMVAKFGRSSRLGERSRGVLDAGSVSCAIILGAMAGQMQKML